MRIEAGKVVHGLLRSVHIEPWMNYSIYREGSFQHQWTLAAATAAPHKVLRQILGDIHAGVVQHCPARHGYGCVKGRHA